MAVEKSDLKFYLTSEEPLMAQIAPSQSIGGYPSETEVLPSALLLNAISQSATSISLSKAFTNTSYVIIDDEILGVVATDNTTLVVDRGALSTVPRYHPADSVVYSATQQALFNSSFNESGKQYRCIAVQNSNETDPFYELRFYVKGNSRNPNSTFKLAVEIPTSELIISTATGGSFISITDTTLINQFEEDEYVGNILMFTNGDNINTGRKIATSDPSTGTFTFVDALAFSVSSGDAYRIEVSPSQRVTSSLISPSVNNSHVSSFSSANGVNNAISIDFSETRISTSDLYPFETVYLWIERTVVPGISEIFEDNSLIFTAVYKR